MIDRGRNWTEVQYESALKQQKDIKNLFEGLFENYDYVALPAVHQFAPTASELTSELRDGLLALTSPASLAGLPVLTVPVWSERGLSGGIQIIMPDCNPDRINTLLEIWGSSKS